MNKKKIGFFLSLSGALAVLAGCGGDYSSSRISSESNPDEVSSSESSSSSRPDVGNKMPTYLKGDFVGKSGTLTLSSDKLMITGNLDLDLVPTSVDSIEIGTTNKLTVVEFDSSFNPSTYRLYADLYGDGFLHLEEKVGESYNLLGTFMPDVSYLGGSYSAYGDSSPYNFYEIFESNFDFEKGVYPASRYFPSYSSYGYSNSWYFLSRLRVNTNNINFDIEVTVEQFDNDDYGYGEGFISAILDSEKNVVGYRFIELDGNVINSTDPGAFANQKLFDGTSSTTIELDPDEKTLTLGDFSGVYVTNVDEKGMRLDVTSNGVTKSFRIGDHYVSVTSGDETKIYVLDSVDELNGNFSKDGVNISIEEDEDENIVARLNGEEVEFSYIIYNNRKSIKFSKDSKEYIVSPELYGTCVLVSVDGVRSYFLNESSFLPLFEDSFVAHDEKGDFAISIDENLKASKGNETGNLSLSYRHGEKYPSLVGKLGDKDIEVTLVQPNIGFYRIILDGASHDCFSKTILDTVYGTYSSNYQDRFVLDQEKLTIDSNVKTYSLKAVYQSGSGTYTLGIEIDGKTFEHNLNKCLVSSDTSYVKLEVFDSIVGVYSQYAKYGEENIKYTSGGEMLLDTVNSSKDGLDKDVKYNYHIMTLASTSSKAVVAFEYGKNDAGESVYIYVYFYDNYVTIADQKYYKNSIYNAWGTYADSSNSNVLYVQNDSIYYNGSTDFISSWEEKDGKLVATSFARKYTFDGDSVSVTSGDNVTTLTRKLTYTDFDKFVGTYTVNEKTFSFVKNDVVGYSLVDGDSKIDLASCYIASSGGKLTLMASSISAKYSLSIDLDSGEITPSYEAGLLPPPPPPLPF